MHKFTFLFSLFVLSQTCSFAQNNYVDSLRRELARPGIADTAAMELSMAIGEAIGFDSPAVAKKQFRAVYDDAQRTNNFYYMADAVSSVGRLFGDKFHYDSAMYYYLLADSLFALDFSQAAIESRATNKTSIAEIERGQSHFEAAIKIYLETMALMEKSNAKNKWLVLAIICSNAGSVYHDLQQPRKALEYDMKALNFYKKHGDPSYIAIAELYAAGDYEDIGQPDEAGPHIERAEMIANQLNSGDLFYRVYNAWGSYYRKISRHENALLSFQKALAYARSGENLFREMNCNRMLGFVYRDLKRYGESLRYMQVALMQTRALKNKLLEAELLKNMAWLQGRLGNNKEATGLYETYIGLSDSLNQEDTKRRINEIENKFQSEKKRDSILTLQKNYQVQSIQLRQKQTVNLALAAGCALLIVIAVLFYKNNKSSNKLHTQRISELEKEKKLLAAQALMKGQEEERSRLARDLHDGVGGLLSGVKLSMSTMKGNIFLPGSNVNAFENVIRQLDQSIAELRRVSHNMMPEALIKYGLKEALENYCENLDISGEINVQIQTYGLENRMEQSVEIVTYRIIQELLSNVIKHAGAKNVLIQLVRESDRFNLTVEDDGKGFDINETGGGMGLSSIRARIDYLNGNLDIVSKKGEGTSVHIEGNLA